MAVEISGALPQLANFTTGAANVVTKVTIGANATKITFRPRDYDGKVCCGAPAAGLTDAGALGAAEYGTLPADAASQLGVQGTHVFFVTSASAGTVVEVFVEGGA